MRIYIVEDDENIRELVVYALTAGGYEAEGFPDAAAFGAGMLRAAPPDLAILDIMLPGEDGLSILKRLRADPATRGLPVILLTAKGSEYDKVLGLDAGADDYLAKPFGVMELVSRVRAVLRRSAPKTGDETDLLEAGSVALDTARHRVTVDGGDISLTTKEFELLRALMEHPGRVFSRELLLDRVWGYSFDVETRTVDVHIRTLRKKLLEAGSRIETVRGVGYRFENSRQAEGMNG